MITKKFLLGTVAAFLGCTVSVAIATDAIPQEVVVAYNSVQAITVPFNNGISTLVGVLPDQLVQVTVKYSSDQAAQLVNLEALDGGEILPSTGPIDFTTACVGDGCISGVPALTLVISVDGTLTFLFQAGHAPGLNQVALVDGIQEVGVQFWVLDQENPPVNPPAATPDNPNY